MAAAFIDMYNEMPNRNGPEIDTAKLTRGSFRNLDKCFPARMLASQKNVQSILFTTTDKVWDQVVLVQSLFVQWLLNGGEELSDTEIQRVIVQMKVLKGAELDRLARPVSERLSDHSHADTIMLRYDDFHRLVAVSGFAKKSSSPGIPEALSQWEDPQYPMYVALGVLFMANFGDRQWRSAMLAYFSKKRGIHPSAHLDGMPDGEEASNANFDIATLPLRDKLANEVHTSLSLIFVLSQVNDILVHHFF
jgi:hypothetical protein